MTDFRLELSDLAIEQINSIFEFHEANQIGKGGDFLASIWDCLESIQFNPFTWQYLGTKEEGIRRAISASPQSIILYDISEERIMVYEIYDSRQNWK